MRRLSSGAARVTVVVALFVDCIFVTVAVDGVTFVTKMSFLRLFRLLAFAYAACGVAVAIVLWYRAFMLLLVLVPQMFLRPVLSDGPLSILLVLTATAAG